MLHSTQAMANKLKFESTGGRNINAREISNGEVTPSQQEDEKIMKLTWAIYSAAEGHNSFRVGDTAKGGRGDGSLTGSTQSHHAANVATNTSFRPFFYYCQFASMEIPVHSGTKRPKKKPWIGLFQTIDAKSNLMN